MAKTAAEVLQREQDSPNFTAELIAGRFRWDLMSSWPVQDPADRAIGDAAAARLRDFLARRVDPVAVDASGELPDGLVDELKRQGYLALAAAPGDGGLGLTPYNVFRVVEAAAGVALPVAMTLAVEAAIGVGAYLPVIPDGPLRELILTRLRAGVVSGTADTEPYGAANQRRHTTATLAPDGRTYRLDGEKVHVGNAPIADLLWTTATVREPDRERVRTFLVDPRSPGVEISSHQFMGLHGFHNGQLRFTGVSVPAEHMFVENGDYEGRITPSITVLLSIGRLYLICAPSLAIGRACLDAVREFAGRRRVDGLRIGAYDEIQRRTAESLADVFAIDAMVEWSLLAGPTLGVNPLLEQNLAKNACSLACWRVVERTMSMLAAEGFETAGSKAARGAPDTPVERLFRDARGLRISGGVDFLLDYWFSQMIVFAGDHLGGAAGGPAGEPDPLNLSGRNAEHLRAVADGVRSLADTRARLTAEYPDAARLAGEEHLHVAIGAAYRELVTMSATLARASRLAGDGDETAQHLADIYCVAARRRLTGWWQRISPGAEPAYAAVSDGWLYDEGR